MTSRLLFILLANMLIMSNAYAETCDAYFPETVQGHSSPSTIKFKNGGTIFNKPSHDGKLLFTNLSSSQNNGHQTCSSSGVQSNCSITGQTAPAFELPSFETSNSNSNITKDSNDPETINTSNIKKLTIKDNAKVTFDATAAPYKIETGDFKNNASITFETGVYWFEKLTITDNVKIFIEGPVIIYVQGKLEVDGNAEVNRTQSTNNSSAGKAKDLFIGSWDEVKLEKNAKVHAVLYAKKVDMPSDNPIFTGAISVADELSLEDNAKVYYEDVSGVECGIQPTLGTPIFSPSDGIMGGQLNGNISFDIGVPGYTVGSNNWPTNEGPEHLIDGVGQKYLNFGEFDTGAIITPAVGCSIVNTIKFWTANDAEARDPTSYKLYGTNSNLNNTSNPISLFTLISEGNLALPSSRNANGNNVLQDINAQTISLTNNSIYSSYLLYFPTVKNQNSANSMQIGEVQTFGSIENCPALLAEWRMDETQWAGNGKPVVDQTGNYDAQTKGATPSNSSPAIPGNPGTCGYARFNGNKDYIELPNSFPNLQDSFTITAWINPQNTDPGSRIFIDDQNNSNGYGFSLGDPGNGKLRFYSRGVNPISVDTTASVPTNSWTFVAAVHNNLTKTRQIFINGVAQTITGGGTSNTYTGTWGVDTGIATIGGETSNSSEKNNLFTGNIDEVRVYSGALSSDQIAAIYRETHQCDDVIPFDHYELTHDGNGLTCAPETITIKACVNTDGTCTDVAASDTSVELVATPASGTAPFPIWSQNPVTIPANSTLGVSVLLSHTSPELVTLSVADQTTYTCNGGSGADCDIQFSDAGFRFLYGIDNKTEIANQIAGTEFSEPLKIQAVENTDGVCSGIFDGNVAIKISQENMQPSGTAGLTFEVDNNDIAKTPDSTNLVLNFDTDSIAILPAPLYNDAGEIRLSANYSDGDINLTGNSNNFWVSPSYLKVSAIKPDGAAINGATSNTSTVYTAGLGFSLIVSAYNSKDILTTNYAPGNIQFKLTRTGPVSTDSVDGRFTYAASSSMFSSLAATSLFQDVNLNNFSAGISRYDNASYSEVGLLNLDLQDNNYGGQTILVEGDAINIGRFIPAYYELGGVLDGTLNENDPFIYTGEMISKDSAIGKVAYTALPEFTITAKSFTDNTTLNYTGDFIKLIADDIDRQIPTFDAIQLGVDNMNNVDLAALLNPAVLAELSPGVLKYQFNSTDNYVYTRNSNALIDPFIAAIYLKINSIEDSDTVTAVDYDTEPANGILTLKPQGVEIRFGRWVMENSYGTETSAQRIPMQLQYWNNNEFITNTADSFTTFVAADARVSKNNLEPTTADPLLSGAGIFTQGKTNNLTVASPGANVRGSVTVEFDVPAWLKFDWIADEDGNYDGSYDDNPSSQVNFGLFRGNDRIIYRQELFD